MVAAPSKGDDTISRIDLVAFGKPGVDSPNVSSNEIDSHASLTPYKAIPVACDMGSPYLGTKGSHRDAERGR